MRRSLVALLLALAAPAVAAAEPPAPPLPDALMSENVEYLGSIKQDVGLTTSAKVVGNRLFVSGGKNLMVYDISDPAKPKDIGVLKVNAAWQNEEVPTNGKVLAVASDTYSAQETCLAAQRATGCIQFFDVRDPANIKIAGIVPRAAHTVECALDCQFFYTSNGLIIDARGVLDGKAPQIAGNWHQALREQGGGASSCHHIRELRPGVLLSACRPFSVMSINAEDGGSPTQPKLLFSGAAAKFVHSARWPREGADDLVLIGGELNFTARCENNDSEFSTYSAKGVLSGETQQFEGPLFQKVPVGNGVYTDGKAPAGVLGCSVHWFQEHASWRNGGLVALSEFEHGIRFLQVKEDGSILEQGYFIPVASSSGAPVWAGKDDVLYNIDYQRGIDIIRWKGEHYVPDGKGGTVPEPDRVPGTNGELPPPVMRTPGPVAKAAYVAARAQQEAVRAAGPALQDERIPFVCRLSGARRG
jgi:hypothetical protein